MVYGERRVAGRVHEKEIGAGKRCVCVRVTLYCSHTRQAAALRAARGPQSPAWPMMER